jgi:hypothetical protein
MSIPDNATIAAAARWIETPTVTPRDGLDWGSFFGPPRYARETISQTVEPYFSEYRALSDEIGETLNADEDGCWDTPDAEWWTPSPAMQAKLGRLAELVGLAWTDVPNPDYDPERAAAWREQREAGFNQVTYSTGQSYHPPPSGH